MPLGAAPLGGSYAQQASKQEREDDRERERESVAYVRGRMRLCFRVRLQNRCRGPNDTETPAALDSRCVSIVTKAALREMVAPGAARRALAQTHLEDSLGLAGRSRKLENPQLSGIVATTVPLCVRALKKSPLPLSCNVRNGELLLRWWPGRLLLQSGLKRPCAYL